jgi:gluconokinase
MLLASEVIVVMGVSGSGKTTIARSLAARIDAAMLDADDFHSPANVAKMARGEPLDDADREGWLSALREQIDKVLAEHRRAVLACSALKRAYRDRLGVGRPDVVLVYLQGSYELIRNRMHARHGHFMKESMLASQFATLEEPTDAITVDVSLPPDEIVDAIVRAL